MPGFTLWLILSWHYLEILFRFTIGKTGARKVPKNTNYLFKPHTCIYQQHQYEKEKNNFLGNFSFYFPL